MTSPKRKDREREALARVREDPTTEEAATVLERALASRRAAVAAEAARLVAHSRLSALTPRVVAAFERFRDGPAGRDPGALAKTACAQALLDLARASDRPPDREVVERVFVPGAHLRQLDPVRGGQVDVAGPLRALCAAGLLERGDARAFLVLVDHLADPEAPVRQAAAKNLAARGGPEAVPVLRLKARLGDGDPRVLGDVCRSLLALDGEDALPVVGAWLETDDDDRFGEAAVAVGAARVPGAFAVLRAAWERELAATRRVLLLTALGLVREEAAVAFLLDVVRDAGADLAAAAVEALGAHGHEEDVRRRLREAAAGRSEEVVRSAVADVLGG